MRFIPHPLIDSQPVSLKRWLKYHIGSWMQVTGARWLREALEICDCCGYPKDMGDHSRCDDIPF